MASKAKKKRLKPDRLVLKSLESGLFVRISQWKQMMPIKSLSWKVRLAANISCGYISLYAEAYKEMYPREMFAANLTLVQLLKHLANFQFHIWIEISLFGRKWNCTKYGNNIYIKMGSHEFWWNIKKKSCWRVPIISGNGTEKLFTTTFEILGLVLKFGIKVALLSMQDWILHQMWLAISKNQNILYGTEISC